MPRAKDTAGVEAVVETAAQPSPHVGILVTQRLGEAEVGMGARVATDTAQDIEEAREEMGELEAKVTPTAGRPLKSWQRAEMVGGEDQVAVVLTVGRLAQGAMVVTVATPSPTLILLVVGQRSTLQD